ncbi:hypothetical protein [Wenzhouxiangella sp. EGI_FJ10305]|uniref:hypothetical protein n=1 Tax=Wenzhouxiangella sp. EGI_FJ10305 TaxID=3243768 RepID=UPI0035D6BA03
MKMNKTNTLLSAMACALIASASVLGATPEASSFQTHIYPETLLIEPADERAFETSVDLIVKGPDNFLMRQHYPAGSLIEFDPQSLNDGTYNYEVRASGATGMRTRGEESSGAQKPKFSTHSGVFTISNGQLVSPDLKEPDTGSQSYEKSSGSSTQAAATGGGELLDQVIVDDLIVDGSACVGFDCVNGENFGSDTIRLKENNLRIHFNDTSNSGSFPGNDWRLVANDQANGGANKFSVEDATAGRPLFTVEAGAPSNSLYVDNGGRIGMGTSTPVVEAHVVDGDSPTLRLEQDSSSGFQAQTWDIAGNESNFFVRDATNGSTLPFRIQPGAPSSSIYIASDGDVGLGTQSPKERLHIFGSGSILPRVRFDNDDIGHVWDVDVSDNGDFRISVDGSGQQEFLLEDASGDLRIQGSFVSSGTALDVPDYVFAPDYNLRPLEEVRQFISEHRHLPNVPSAKDVAKKGLDLTEFNLRLLEKVEELTLYTMQQDQEIKSLKSDLEALAKQID